MVSVNVERASDDFLESVCTATIGTELPFLITENFADAKFLIGGNRPSFAIRQMAVNGSLFLNMDIEMQGLNNGVSHFRTFRSFDWKGILTF